MALIQSPLSGVGVIEPPDEVNLQYTNACLIVCPVSVIANWKEQIRAHVGPSSVCNYHVYHGKEVKVKLKLLKSCDIIITSYTTLANEYVVDDEGNPISKKSKKLKADEKLENGKLFKIPWRRIVLDEGHIIRNRKTRAYKACEALVGERRWSEHCILQIQSLKLKCRSPHWHAAHKQYRRPWCYAWLYSGLPTFG